jgi:hypothetical protein
MKSVPSPRGYLEQRPRPEASAGKWGPGRPGSRDGKPPSRAQSVDKGGGDGGCVQECKDSGALVRSESSRPRTLRFNAVGFEPHIETHQSADVDAARTKLSQRLSHRYTHRAAASSSQQTRGTVACALRSRRAAPHLPPSALLAPQRALRGMTPACCRADTLHRARPFDNGRRAVVRPALWHHMSQLYGATSLPLTRGGGGGGGTATVRRRRRSGHGQAARRDGGERRGMKPVVAPFRRVPAAAAEGNGYAGGDSFQVTNEHFVLKNPIKGPFPAGIKTAVFGTGCVRSQWFVLPAPLAATATCIPFTTKPTRRSSVRRARPCDDRHRARHPPPQEHWLCCGAVKRLRVQH